MAMPRANLDAGETVCPRATRTEDFDGESDLRARGMLPKDVAARHLPNASAVIDDDESIPTLKRRDVPREKSTFGVSPNLLLGNNETSDDRDVVGCILHALADPREGEGAANDDARKGARSANEKCTVAVSAIDMAKNEMGEHGECAEEGDPQEGDGDEEVMAQKRDRSAANVQIPFLVEEREDDDAPGEASHGNRRGERRPEEDVANNEQSTRNGPEVVAANALEDAVAGITHGDEGDEWMNG